MVLFLFSTVLQFLQCPARWTGLQLVISPGPNPLPAVVHLKYSVSGSKVEDDEFYGLDIVDKFDDEAMQNMSTTIQCSWQCALSCAGH